MTSSHVPFMTLHEQVAITLGDQAPEFDIPAIVHEICVTYGTVCSVDSIPYAGYWMIVRSHEQRKPRTHST